MIRRGKFLTTLPGFIISLAAMVALADSTLLISGRHGIANAATLVVTNLADDGPGTLRQFITNSASGDIITFATNGTITLTSGELFVTNDLTILGPGATNLAISGNTNSRVFNISSNIAVAISGMTIRDGKAADGEHTHFTYIPVSSGGGILNAGILSLSNCHLTSNLGGKGFSDSQAPQPGGDGGGVFNTGSLALTGCTLSNNRAGNSGLDPFGTRGGNGGGIFNSGLLSMTTCTISGNRGGDGGRFVGGNGGGIYSVGSLSVVGCTICRNISGSSYNVISEIGGNGGGICNENYQTAVLLQNTIVALNLLSGDSFLSSAPQADAAGYFISQGHNLIGFANEVPGFGSLTNGANADIIGFGDPRLGPLADNGGPIPTCALLPGSPAIDAGDDALLDAPFNLTTDQRGQPRRFGAHVDFGAVEHNELHFAAPPLFTNGTFQFTITNVPGVSFILQAATNIPATNWINLGPATPLGGGLHQFTDTNAASSARFYRIVAP